MICPPFHPTLRHYGSCKKAVDQKRQRSTRSPAASLNSVTSPQNIPRNKTIQFSGPLYSAGEFTGGHTNACAQSLNPSVLALRFHVTSSGPRQKNQINPGSISVDRNASITVVPYNAWFQLTHLLKIQHLHISQFEVPAMASSSNVCSRAIWCLPSSSQRVAEMVVITSWQTWIPT